MKKLVFLVLALYLCSAQAALDHSQGPELRAQNTLKLGIFPRRNAKTTYKMFKPLAAYLSKQLGREVKLVVSKNFSQFWKAVQAQEFDLVHYNQLHYIESHDQDGYKVILMNEEFGDATLTGAIAVRKDNNINSIQDLRGKSILFGGDKTAMIAYIINTYYLRKMGLNNGDYRELFAKNPPNATLAMYHRRVDAAGIGNIGLKIPMLEKSGIDTNEIKLFVTSSKLSHLPWAVKSSVSNELGAKIQTILSHLVDSEDGKKILRDAKLTALRVANDSDYDEIRKILREYREIVNSKSSSQGSQANLE